MKKMYFANSITRDVDPKYIARETPDSVWVYENGKENRESKVKSNGMFFDTEIEALWYLLEKQRDELKHFNTQADKALENVLEISHKIQKLKLQNEQSK